MTRLSSTSHLESPEFPFSAELYRFRPYESMNPHSHEFVELVYVAEGTGEHEYRGTSYRISEGDVFIIAPDSEHAYRVGPENPPLVVYNVLFMPSLLQTELEALAQVTPFVDFFYVEPFLRNSVEFETHLKLSPGERLEMRALIDQIVIEMKEKKLGYRIMTKTQLISLFVFLSRCYLDHRNAPLSALVSDEKMMLHVCGFIRQHFAQPLTLQQVSQLCGLSQSAFSAKFKEYVGKTFIEYRNEIRIKTAQTRLTETDDKILRIAQEVGFDDLSFFNKLFKTVIGLSPGQYRAEQRHSKH